MNPTVSQIGISQIQNVTIQLVFLNSVTYVYSCSHYVECYAYDPLTLTLTLIQSHTYTLVATMLNVMHMDYPSLSDIVELAS